MIEKFDFTKWFLLVLPMTLSAGPANIMSASSGAVQGFRKSLPFLFGLAIPAISYSLLIGFGASNFISSYPFFISGLQYAGAVYILYLAMKFLYPAKKSVENNTAPKIGFRDGFFLSVLNGKLMTMLILMYSVMLNSTSTYQEVWLMTVLLFVTGISSNIIWIFGGKLLSKFFVSERAIRIQNITFGLMLTIVAIWLIIEV